MGKTVAGSSPRRVSVTREAKPSLGRTGHQIARCVLEVGGVERVAGSPLALFVTRRKPSLALSRRAVRPGLRIDLTLGLALNSVVAHSGGGIQGLPDLVRGQRLQA